MIHEKRQFVQFFFNSRFICYFSSPWLKIERNHLEDIMSSEKSMLRTLETLINCHSPTGYHKPIMNLIKDELTKMQVPYKETNKGALAVTLSSDNLRGRIFSAHVDTLGAMVSAIKSNGTLEFTLLGGYMYQTLESENCSIRTKEGKEISGTVQTIKPSVHIHGNDAKTLERKQENMEIVIDEKVSSMEDTIALGINVGDFVFMDPKLKILTMVSLNHDI